VIDLRGEQVRLRPLTAADLELLARTLPRADPAGRAARLDLAIEVDGRLVGDVQARSSEDAFPPGNFEIGIDLLAGERGHGYGTEALRLFTAHLFEGGAGRIQASTALDNVSMRRVLERVGYRFEGVLRGFMPKADGGRDDYALYAVIRTDSGAVAEAYDLESRAVVKERT